MWDRNSYRADVRAGVPEGGAGIRLQTEGYGRIWKSSEALVEMIQPFTCRHDKDRLWQELLADQASNDGSRSYSLCEDDLPED